MARAKNTNRRKRKYTDLRKTATERSRSLKQPRHEMKMARINARTNALVGKLVEFQIAGDIKPRVGTVVSIVEAPEGALRKGHYLSIKDSDGTLYTKLRSRVKPIRETNAV